MCVTVEKSTPERGVPYPEQKKCPESTKIGRFCNENFRPKFSENLDPELF